ncbi:hypothetical protein [Pseudonocardia nigra]|uniref:hypothetical protein n=1 Tax=Pseudonocardia nigra TaxID=1921578 RepID=UPI001C5E85E3|nr:hypothetical protein [Pseudonocardia nigra]
MTAIFLTIAVVVVLALVGAAVQDVRARRRGRRLRGTGTWFALRETRRDLRGNFRMGFGLGDDLRWTAAARRDADPEAQRRREEQ